MHDLIASAKSEQSLDLRGFSAENARRVGVRIRADAARDFHPVRSDNAYRIASLEAADFGHGRLGLARRFQDFRPPFGCRGERAPRPDLRSRGEEGLPPSQSLQCASARGEEVPLLAQQYIADLIAGTLRRRAGRKRKAALLGQARLMDDALLISRVEEVTDALARAGSKKPRDAAIKKLAPEQSVDGKTLEKYYYSARGRVKKQP